MNTNETQKVTPQTLSELLANEDSNILHSLRSSVYPGAKDESIGMVLAYCKAKKYDPLAKAVHIVPMNVRDPVTGYYEWRDTIMPGIASYRIDAERTGAYMGITRPTYGNMINTKLGGTEISYPEWARITVKKMVQGIVCDFEAEEYWDENYANKGKDKITKEVNPAPNDMWAKRRRGQLAKCTEAQALRKAFPGIVSSVPTFEEMEGKELGKVDKAISLIEISEPVRPEHLEILKEKITRSETQEIDICRHLEIDCLESMTTDALPEVMRLLDLKIAKKKKSDLPINALLANQEALSTEMTESAKEFFGDAA